MANRPKPISHTARDLRAARTPPSTHALMVLRAQVCGLRLKCLLSDNTRRAHLMAREPFLDSPGKTPWQNGKSAVALQVDPGDRAGQLRFDFSRAPLKKRNPKSRFKYFKILPPDSSNPQSSCTLVMFSPGESKILKTPDEDRPASRGPGKSQRDLMKPFKAPQVPENPDKSKDPYSFALKPVFNYHKSRFRVLHDPSLYPISSGRALSKFEVQYGLSYNTFTNGTIIQDVITFTRHEVVIQKVFKLTEGGGMELRPVSKLVPPHPMIQLRADSEDGTDNP